MRSLAALLLFAAPALADEIRLTDGRIIADCTVQTETLSTVTYKATKSKEEVPSDKVLRVIFSAKPQLVESADTAVDEDQIGAAIEDFKEYVDGVIGTPQKKFEWAPAYAMFRLVELQAMAGDTAGVADAVKKLEDHASDSRYLPEAYLRLAQLYAENKKDADALGTLDRLDKLITERSLSDRWKLELRLARVLCDSKLADNARRSQLEQVQSAAKGELSIVSNRAAVAIGESWLGGQTKDYAKAKVTFQKIVDDPQADDLTLAAAYTGLGECIFHLTADGPSGGDTTELKKALMAFLRVAVVYENEVRYVPKALFYAGLVYERMGTPEAKDRAQTLFSSLRRNYPGSEWATESKRYKRG